MKRLGVNIDHIATLRQARKIAYPDPIQGALIAQQAGADQITCHLREDRRHIQDLDVERLKESLKIPLNLEMAATSEMLRFASRLKPTLVTLVPEKREELTTEGGLELFHDSFLKEAIQSLKKDSVRVSLFINPDLQDIDQAMKLGACEIELHTGSYAEVHEAQQVQREFLRLQMAAEHAQKIGHRVYAGHGLHYQNTKALTVISEIEEYNIGHSIISQAVFVGLENAVREMKALLS